MTKQKHSPSEITREMMARVPRERDVISFSQGMSTNDAAFLLKTVMRNGQSEVIMLVPTVAIRIARGLRAVIAAKSYPDVRRRRGDARREDPVISEFLERQPDFEPEDWNGAAPHVTAAVRNCMVQAFDDAVFIVLQETEDLFKVIRLDPKLTYYLAEWIEDAEKSNPRFRSLDPDGGNAGSI